MLVACPVLLWSGAPEARAWGADGHRIVAELAERQLQPKAAAEVRRLLSAEPGATMGSVASWADEVRTRADGKWHYVNLPPNAGCHYVAARDCRNGACVVSAIEREVRILGSRAPDDQRLMALKYVIHFVGDVHQPLHAGHGADKGGNTYQLQAFGRGTNLHALWDTGLLVHWPGGVHALEQAASTPIIGPATGSPQDWAEQSCRLMEQDWFYPQTRRVDDAYLSKAEPVVQRQLQLAGARLATALNQALGR